MQYLIDNWRVLSERLSGLRTAKGLTRHELAVRSGIDASLITRYEQGRARPRPDALTRLADALDVSADYLLGRAAGDDPFGAVASKFALERFLQVNRVDAPMEAALRRVAVHPSAPKTMMDWSKEAELLALAVPGLAPQRHLPGAKSTNAGEVARRRERGEYVEMPGLRLTTEQAQRLWGLDRAACDALVDKLVDAKFLQRTPDGRLKRMQNPVLDDDRPRTSATDPPALQLSSETPRSKQ